MSIWVSPSLKIDKKKCFSYIISNMPTLTPTKKPKIKLIREFQPTVAEKRALVRARKNFAAGKCVTLAKLKRELASTR